MLSYLDGALIRLKIGLGNMMDEFRSDETGVAGIVAAIILVLIAVILAATFWTNIQELVTGWWESIKTKSSGIGG